MFEEGICCIKYEMKIFRTDGRSWHYDMLFALHQVEYRTIVGNVSPPVVLYDTWDVIYRNLWREMVLRWNL